MRQDGQVFESIELSFDYLPGFSARQGYFYFQQDPSIGELHVFPLSYVELIGPYLSKLCDSPAASMIGDDRVLVRHDEWSVRCLPREPGSDLALEWVGAELVVRRG